ncbi:MAG: amidohydrolase family protein [Methanoregula sp.]|nr:amidohydrolase family protein [Methanoregula sp.]
MNAFVIRAGNFWDGITEKPIGQREILVIGERIAEIGKTIREPKGAEIIDLPGHTVTPGFIDCHVHLTLRPELIGSFWSYSPSYKALLGAEALRTLLTNGFTTVRDCGDMDLHGFTVRDLKLACEQGIIPGSRLVCSGHMISSRGGHMNAMLSLAPDSHPWENCLADGADEIRKVVRNEIKHGAEWVKYAASGGFSTAGDDPLQVTYTQEEMNALVAAARDFNRPVAVHVLGDEAIRRSVNAGVRSIEHGSMVSTETLRFMEEKGVYIVPTQLMATQPARMVDDDAYWTTLNAPAHMRVKMHKYQDALIDGARNIASSKVKIAFGTDLGIFTFRTNGAAEFHEMVTNGIAPVRALRAATGMAAELLQREDIGVLAPGRCADIVAMPGDPFTDITVTEKVDFVMKSGIVVKSAGISVL